MKTFLLLLLLGSLIYFMYMRASDYGYPWEEQVVITSYESNKRFRGGSEQLYVHGEIRNRTRKRVNAEVECRVLPPGMTLTRKATASVALAPQEALPFDLDLKSRDNATGAECKVKDWSTGGGLEEKVMRSMERFFNRLRHRF